MINGMTTNTCHVATPGCLAPRVETDGVSSKTIETRCNSELVAGEVSNSFPDITTDSSSDDAATNDHRHEYMTVSPAKRLCDLVSVSNRVRQEIRENRLMANIMGVRFLQNGTGVRPRVMS
jgi:hypothetical protein